MCFRGAQKCTQHTAIPDETKREVKRKLRNKLSRLKAKVKRVYCRETHADTTKAILDMPAWLHAGIGVSCVRLQSTTIDDSIIKLLYR